MWIFPVTRVCNEAPGTLEKFTPCGVSVSVWFIDQIIIRLLFWFSLEERNNRLGHGESGHFGIKYRNLPNKIHATENITTKLKGQMTISFQPFQRELKRA